MNLNSLYIAIVIGLIVSLIFTEKVGIVPGGLIVPGYLAMFFDQPLLILLVLAISSLTYIIVVHGISRITLLYGRRKFVAMLITAILITLGLKSLYPVIPYEILQLRGIGVIVPALIANSIQKQGWAYSLGSTVLLSGTTFVILSIAI